MLSLLSPDHALQAFHAFGLLGTLGAAMYTRMLDTQKITANFKQPKTDVVDVGSSNRVTLHVRVVKAGTAGTLILQESAVNEDDAFRTSGVSLALNALANTKLVLADPLRFLRLVGDGDVAGDPVGLVDLVGRE